MAKRGYRIDYDDDLVEVFNDKGKSVYRGILDYCPYKDEPVHWNDKKRYYELPQGYIMVGLTRH